MRPRRRRNPAQGHELRAHAPKTQRKSLDPEHASLGGHREPYVRAHRAICVGTESLLRGHREPYVWAQRPLGHRKSTRFAHREGLDRPNNCLYEQYKSQPLPEVSSTAPTASVPRSAMKAATSSPCLLQILTRPANPHHLPPLAGAGYPTRGKNPPAAEPPRTLPPAAPRRRVVSPCFEMQGCGTASDQNGAREKP